MEVDLEQESLEQLEARRDATFNELERGYDELIGMSDDDENLAAKEIAWGMTLAFYEKVCDLIQKRMALGIITRTVYFSE